MGEESLHTLTSSSRSNMKITFYNNTILAKEEKYKKHCFHWFKLYMRWKVKKRQNSMQRHEISHFSPHILLSCQYLMPPLPTMQHSSLKEALWSFLTKVVFKFSVTKTHCASLFVCFNRRTTGTIFMKLGKEEIRNYILERIQIMGQIQNIF